MIIQEKLKKAGMLSRSVRGDILLPIPVVHPQLRDQTHTKLSRIDGGEAFSIILN